MIKPPVRHVERIREVISEYPGEGQIFFDIDQNIFTYKGNTTPDPKMIDVIVFEGSTRHSGEMVAPTNIGQRITRDIEGNFLVERTVQTSIFVMRSGNAHRESLLEIADFIADFIHWTTEMYIENKIPKFGDTDLHNEEFILSGGMKWEDLKDQAGVETYMFQLNQRYFLFYENQQFI